ncbi:peptidoglycan DD-metalloendopeptidase family protein [Rhizobium ruizarguesonis]|uniref:peptidoglycan DD-metalloendopeptidase family protein n=1 Tax=Rhizobium ruizarguesonis TaxID=2081791 RepID=UPI0018D5587D|nr:M23 family metallopeptidase [Rhizobium ruizarguesonis]
MVYSMPSRSILAAAIIFSWVTPLAAQSPIDCPLPGITVAPTDNSKTFIRKGNGEWGAPRASGGTHRGVDLIVNASYPDNAPYAVQPMAAGTVAYSRLNGTQTTGYGNLVVIDHGTGCYSLYAHLANRPFTPIAAGGNLLVNVGDSVGPGSPIGYFVDIKSDVDSSGNAQTTSPEARHQVHVAFIRAPSGRTSTTSLAAIVGNDGAIVDPTAFLLSQGYQYY